MYFLLLLLFLLLLGGGEIWPRKGRKMLGWKRAGAFACVCPPLHLAQEPIFVLLLPPKRSTVPIRRVAATLEEAWKATAAACKKCFPSARRALLSWSLPIYPFLREIPHCRFFFSLWIPGAKQPTSKGVAVTECDSRLRLGFLMRKKTNHRVLKNWALH